MDILIRINVPDKKSKEEKIKRIKRRIIIGNLIPTNAQSHPKNTLRAEIIESIGENLCFYGIKKIG